jgi:hypothetical protein
VADDDRELRAEIEAVGAAISEGVARQLPRWVPAEVDRLLTAWGRADRDAHAAALRRAEAAGIRAAARIGDRLDRFFAAEPGSQSVTPLQIVRDAVAEPTEILRDLGVPPVERDPFEERAHPDDRYGLVPRQLGDLGDPDLGPLLLAWGVLQARMLRHRP